MIQRILLALVIALGIGASAPSAQAALLSPGSYGHNAPANIKFGAQSYGHPFSGLRVRIGGKFGGVHGSVHRGLGKHPGKLGYKQASLWIPGRYVTECQRVWVPGHTDRVWCPAIYKTHYDPCGTPYQVLVKQGHYKTVQHPGYWENRSVQVWQPGYWSG